MPLEKHLVPVVFNKGVDTKSNNKVASSSDTLVDLRNAVFTTTEKLTKRNGHAALTAGILGGGTIAAGKALALRGSELLLADGSNLYSYSSAAATPAWVNKGPLLSPTVTTTPLMASQYTLTGYDCALSANGLCCAAAERTDASQSANYAGVIYSITDIATGNSVVGPTVVNAAATAGCPKVISAGGYFLIYYVKGNTLGVSGAGEIRCYQIDQTTLVGTDFSCIPVSAGTNGLGQAQTFDVIYDQSALVVLGYVNNAATNGLSIATMSPSTPGSVAITNTAAAAKLITLTLCQDRSSLLNIFIGATKVAQSVYFKFNISSFTFTTTETLLDATASINSITAVSISSSSSSITFYESIEGVTGGGGRDTIRTNTVIANVVGTAAIFALGVTACGRAYQISNAPFLPCSFMVATLPVLFQIYAAQTTWFLLNGSAQVVAKCFAGNFSGYCVNQSSRIIISATGVTQMLPNSNLYGSNYVFPAAVVTRLSAPMNTSNYGSNFIAQQYQALQAITVTMTDATNGYASTQLAGETLFAGGVVNSYDGGQSASGSPAAIEHGFNYYPYFLSTSGSTGTTGYSYCATYEWTDNSGVIHRSAPSTILGPVTALNTTITIPTLRLTQKTNSLRGGVRIVLYRTTLNGLIYYQVNNTAAANDTLLNDATAQFVTYTDNLADTSASLNNQIYTTGNVLQNYPPNPLASVVTHRNRVWGIDTTSPLSLWFSKQVIQSTNVAAGSPVEFSAFLTLNVDPKGGACTALASLDDKLIIFKADRIFGVTGQGPDSTGGQNDFSDALLVTGDTGCTAPKSITNVPSGIMFQGSKGIYLLDRGLNCVYIGAPVEAYTAPGTGAVVCGAQLIPTTNQVRFALSNVNTTLVYDYFVGQWSVFTVDRAQAASVIWSSKYAYLGSAGVVCQEAAGVYTDPGNAYVPLKIQTSWLSLAGYQGFKRIRRVLIDGNIGSNVNSANVSVVIAYNYGDNTAPTTQTAVFDPGPNSSGSGDWQERIHCTLQKCESIQITISDAQNLTVSQYLDLTAITLEVAAKRGAFKMPAAASTS